MSLVEAFPLAPLEIACGIVLGISPPETEPPVEQTMTPIVAFERAVLRALERPPCLVSFSGGRDSSAVLAVATHVARREGLPLPIPATNRFAGVPLSDETDWQELVVSHLGLGDWVRYDVGDELDCIGPVATGVLRRHGLLWPFNAFFHMPFLQRAKGGSMLTGIGGDEVLGGSRWARAESVVARRVRPRSRDALRLALALAPAKLRAPVLRRRLDLRFPWLRPDALRRLRDLWATQDAAEPFGWGTSFSWWRSLRYWQAGQRSLDVLGADVGAQLVHPFADPSFSAALARLPGNRRFDDRSAAMSMLFGDLLPPMVLDRASKASFDGAFFNAHSRRFAETWLGEGADPALVDVDTLRIHWNGSEPDARSYLLMQSAWLDRELANQRYQSLKRGRKDHSFG